MAARFVTIGHSSRTPDEVLDMLRQADVGLLVDVRAFPHSRANPAFNIENFGPGLARFQIGYRHCRALGGRRGRRAGVDDRLNGLWRVHGFHNYADYALSDEFDAALREVIFLGKDSRVALMCSEAAWWRCHRRIIADYLMLGGHPVDHLMGGGRVMTATPTQGARRTPSGKVLYPAAGLSASAAESLLNMTACD